MAKGQPTKVDVTKDDEGIHMKGSRFELVMDADTATDLSWQLLEIAGIQRQRFHVPQIASGRKGWGVFCAACSIEANDYVYPCRLPDSIGWNGVPRLIVEAQSNA
jgi:hypothetical protein